MGKNDDLLSDEVYSPSAEDLLSDEVYVEGGSQKKNPIGNALPIGGKVGGLETPSIGSSPFLQRAKERVEQGTPTVLSVKKETIKEIGQPSYVPTKEEELKAPTQKQFEQQAALPTYEKETAFDINKKQTQVAIDRSKILDKLIEAKKEAKGTYDKIAGLDKQIESFEPQFDSFKTAAEAFQPDIKEYKNLTAQIAEIKNRSNNFVLEYNNEYEKFAPKLESYKVIFENEKLPNEKRQDAYENYNAIVSVIKNKEKLLNQAIAQNEQGIGNLETRAKSFDETIKKANANQAGFGQLYGQYKSLIDERNKEAEGLGVYEKRMSDAQNQIKQKLFEQSQLEDVRQNKLEKEYSTWLNFAESLPKMGIEAVAGMADMLNTLGFSGDPESPETREEAKKETKQNIQKLRKFGDSFITQELPKNYEKLFQGDFSVKKLVNVGFNAMASTAPTIAAGLIGGPVAGVMAGAGMAFGESKEIMKEAGLTEEQAEAAAFGLSIPIGLLENYGAEDIVKLFSKEAIGASTKIFLRNIAGKTLTKEQLFNEAKNTIGQIIKDGAPQILKEGVKESITEVSQGEVNEVAKQAAQEFTGVDLDENMSWSDYLKQQAEVRGEEGVGGFLGGTSMQTMGVGIKAGYKNLFSTFNPSAYQKALELLDPSKMEAFSQEVQQEVQDKVLTQEQADLAFRNIQLIQETNKLIPASIDNKDLRTEALNLVIEKQNIEKEIEGKDKDLAVKENERLAEIKAGLNNIAKGEKPFVVEEVAEVDETPETIVEVKPILSKNTTATDEKYGTVDRNDGKGVIDLTRAEYEAEMGKMDGVSGLAEYPIYALLVKERVSDGNNKLLEGEDADYQNKRIEKTIASGVKAGLTREQIFMMLNANGHVFNLGNDSIAMNQFIQNKIDGKDNRTFADFKSNPNAKAQLQQTAPIIAETPESATMQDETVTEGAVTLPTKEKIFTYDKDGNIIEAEVLSKGKNTTSILIDGKQTLRANTELFANKEDAQKRIETEAGSVGVGGDVERIEIPRYFTFKELGGGKGKSGKAMSSVEADKNEEIAENFKQQLQEGDKLIEPNGTVTYFKNGKVVKADGSMYGMVDIPAFITGVTIERSKQSLKATPQAGSVGVGGDVEATTKALGEITDSAFIGNLSNSISDKDWVDGKTSEENIAITYHNLKSKGIENDFTKAVEQSLKETTQAGSGGGGEVMPKEISDLYSEAASLRFTLNALRQQMGGKTLVGKAKTEYENTKTKLDNIELKLSEYEKNKSIVVKATDKEQVIDKSIVNDTIDSVDSEYGNFLLNEIDKRHKEKYNGENIKSGLAKQFNETLADRGENRAISNLEDVYMNYVPTEVRADAYQALRKNFEKEQSLKATPQTGSVVGGDVKGKLENEGFKPTLKPNGENEFILQVDDTKPNGKRSVGVIGLKTVEVGGKKFLSIGMTNVREGYEGKGLATNMYRYLMENLPEGYDGILSPKETRWNNEQIPKIHEKLSKEYDKTELDNGDIVFKNKAVEQSLKEPQAGSVGVGGEAKSDELVVKKIADKEIKRQLDEQGYETKNKTAKELRDLYKKEIGTDEYKEPPRNNYKLKVVSKKQVGGTDIRLGANSSDRSIRNNTEKYGEPIFDEKTNEYVWKTNTLTLWEMEDVETGKKYSVFGNKEYPFSDIEQGQPPNYGYIEKPKFKNRDIFEVSANPEINEKYGNTTLKNVRKPKPVEQSLKETPQAGSVGVGGDSMIAKRIRDNIKDLPEKDLGDAEANKNWNDIIESRKKIKSMSDEELLKEVQKGMDGKKINQAIYESYFGMDITAKDIEAELQSLKEPQAGSVAGGDVVGKTFRDNYNRTFEVKGENAGILTLEDVDTGKILRKKKSEVLSDFKEIIEPDVVDKAKTITDHLPKGGELKGVTEVKVSDNGEEVSYGTKTSKTSITVKGLSADDIKQEIEFEKKVLAKSKRDAENFNEDEIRFAKGMTRQEKEDAIKMHKQSLINNEQIEKIVIPFYEKHLEIAEQSLQPSPQAAPTSPVAESVEPIAEEKAETVEGVKGEAKQTEPVSKNPLKSIFSKSKKAKSEPVKAETVEPETQEIVEPIEAKSGWHILNKDGGAYTVVSQYTGQTVRVEKGDLKNFTSTYNAKDKAPSLTERNAKKRAELHKEAGRAVVSLRTQEQALLHFIYSHPIKTSSFTYYSGLSGKDIVKMIKGKVLSKDGLSLDKAVHDYLTQDINYAYHFEGLSQQQVQQLIVDTIWNYGDLGKGGIAQKLIDIHKEQLSKNEVNGKTQEELIAEQEYYDDLALEEIGINNESVFVKSVFDAFGEKVSEEQILKYLNLVNVRAKVWSELTGLPSDKWYYRYINDIIGEEVNNEVKSNEMPPEEVPFQEYGGVTKGQVSFLSDGRAIIQAFEKADFSTMVHETAHIWRRELYDTYDLMEQGSKKNALASDIAKLERAMGVEEGVWGVNAEEKFARSMEEYLKTGKAPTRSLEALYEKFKEWLGNIYNGSNIEIVTPTIRKVLDRMFTGEYVEGESEIGEGKGANDVLFQQSEYYSEKQIDDMLKEAISDGLDEAKANNDEYTYQEAYGRFLEANGYLEANGMKPISLVKFQSIWLSSGGAEITATIQQDLSKYQPSESDESASHASMVGLSTESTSDPVKALAKKLEKYGVLKDGEVRAKADALIADFGIDGAYEIASNNQNLLDNAVRTHVFSRAIIEFNRTGQEGKLEGAMVRMKDWGKELGQGISAFREMYMSNPEAMWIMIKSDAKASYLAKFDNAQKEIKKLKATVLKLQKKRVAEATGNLFGNSAAKGKIEKAAKVVDSQNEKTNSVSPEKISRFKELASKLGKAFNILKQGDIEANNDIVEMISIAVEMGGKDLNSLYNIVQKQAGKSIAKNILPYLQNALPKVKSGGVDFAVPSRQEIDKFILQKGIGTTFLTTLKSKTAKQIDSDISKDAVLKGLMTKMANVISEQNKRPRTAQEQAVKLKRSAGDIIKEAFDNIEKSKSILDAAKAEWESQGATQAELERLDAYFGDFFEKPFSEKEANRLKGEAIRKLGKQADFTPEERKVQAENILNDTLSGLGLSPKAERELRRKIGEALEEKSSEKVATELKGILRQNGRRQNADVMKKLQDFVNLNGLSDQASIDAFVGKYGQKVLGEEVGKAARMSDADRLQAKNNAIGNIIAQLGLTGRDAADVTAMLGQKWDSLSNTQRANELTRLNAIAKKNGKAPKAALDLLQDFVNLNGLSDQASIDAFVQKNGKKLLAAAVKNSGFENIKQVVDAHFNGQDRVAGSLVQKLIDELGLSQSQSTELAVTLTEEFKKEFDKINVPKVVKEKISKAERLLQLVSSNAFSDEEFLKYFAKASGWKDMEITPEENAQVKLMQERFDSAKDNLKKQRVLDDAVRFMKSKEGVNWIENSAAMWYANVLSSPDTHGVNSFSNLIRLFTDVIFLGTVKEGVRSGSTDFAKVNAAIMAKGLAKGYKEALNIVMYGGSPIRGNAKMANFQPLEVKGTIGYKLRLRYVGRLLQAADVLTYEPAREQKAFQDAYKKQIADGFPPPRAVERALIEINRTDRAFQITVKKAELATKEYIDSINAEYDIKVDDVKNSTLSDKAKKDKLSELSIERNKLIARENSDTFRRIYAMLDANTKSETIEKAQEYGQIISYNHNPNGIVGAAVGLINQATKVPILGTLIISKFARFLNVPSNVINEFINWTPVGGLRSFTEYGSITESVARKTLPIKAESLKKWFAKDKTTLDEREISDLRYKALIGSAAIAAGIAWALSGDDEDEPVITGAMTSNAANNYLAQKSGVQRNSIRIGDKYVSYEFLPLRFVFQIIGDMSDYKRYVLKGKEPTKKDLDFWFWFPKTLGTSFFNAIYLNSFASSMDDLFEIFSANVYGESKVGERVANWALGQGLGYVPYSGATRWAFNEGYNIAGKPMLETKEDNTKNTIIKRAAARTGALNNGGLGTVWGVEFTPKVDILGHDIPRDADRFYSSLTGDGIRDIPKVSPIEQAKWVKQHPNAIIDLFVEMGEYKKNPSPSECFYLEKEKDGATVEKITATPVEYELFLKTRNRHAETQIINQFADIYPKYQKYSKLYSQGKYLEAWRVREKVFLDIDKWYLEGNAKGYTELAKIKKQFNSQERLKAGKVQQ